MSDIEYSNEENISLTTKLQDYIRDELDHNISRFDAEFFLEFISKEIGEFYYNRGLNDAQAIFSSKFEDTIDAIYQIKTRTKF